MYMTCKTSFPFLGSIDMLLKYNLIDWLIDWVMFYALSEVFQNLTMLSFDDVFTTEGQKTSNET